MFWKYLAFIAFACFANLISLNSSQSHELKNAENYSKLEKLKFALNEQSNTEPFELFVTLGSNCLSKFRVQHFLNMKTKNNIKDLNINHMFDWMFILNYSAFGEALLNDFEDVFGLQYLDVINDCGGRFLENKKYNFLFKHAFDGFNQVNHFENRNRLTKELFKKYFHEDQFHSRNQVEISAIVNSHLLRYP